MSVHFVDTNILIYAHDKAAGDKHVRSLNLISRLTDEGMGGISIQVLTEFYAVSRRLGMPDDKAEQVIYNLQAWAIHRPDVSDLLRAARLQRRYQINWWDALILNSATELGCEVLWTEDLAHGQEYGPVTVRNPFH
jgi:predicted nucleic acid-binding protein